MPLAPWLIVALIVLVLAGVVLFVWWRRRRQAAFAACPRCMTVFDPQTWNVRNTRKHYQGRYTITPVFICPKCGFAISPAQF